MPEKIGGAHMAALVTKPYITEFIANLTGQGSDISLTFEELSLNNISENTSISPSGTWIYETEQERI